MQELLKSRLLFERHRAFGILHLFLFKSLITNSIRVIFVLKALLLRDDL